MATQAKKNTNKTQEIENKEIETKVIIEEKVNNNETELKEKDEEIAKLKQENQDKDKKFEELLKNFAILQEQINSVRQQNNNFGVPQSEDIEIGCRAIYGGVLATNDSRINIKFECNETKFVDSEDLKLLFRESGRDNRLIFEEDTFYFVDEANYAKFKIKKRVDLSKENIVRILTTMSPNDTIGEINKMTNNLINFSVVHALQFEIAKLLIDKTNPLANWQYENRAKLEKYLNRKFDDLMASINVVELLGRKKFN